MASSGPQVARGRGGPGCSTANTKPLCDKKMNAEANSARVLEDLMVPRAVTTPDLWCSVTKVEVEKLAKQKKCVKC